VTLVQFAKKFHYLREVGQNQGLRVNGIQIWAGGQPGDSWCMEFVWFILDIWYEGKCPFARMQNVHAFLVLARANGWEVTVPVPGDLVISVDETGHGHHIGFCTEVSPFTTFAGNTSKDGKSSNGDRAAEHAVSMRNKVFVRVPPP
jgi:hypothetical protein